MELKRLVRLAAALIVGGTSAITLPAHAAPFSDLVIFGDSLSDTGNLNLFTGGAFPDPGDGPYFGGRFSDGPLWVETLASGLGLASAAAPALAGGNNYAFAGARTGTDAAPPGLLAQIGGLWAPTHAAADPNALYVLVAGGNNMRDARSAFPGMTAAGAAGRQAAANQAAVDLISGLGLLASMGAQHVLIANLPDLGFTPEAALLGVQAASSDASARFNALMPVVAGVGMQTFGLDLSFLDLAGLSAAIIDDALNHGGATYGITNVTSPCAGFLFSDGSACSVSLFSDALHPSARAHAILGQAALAAVGVVPEPNAAVLMLIGLLGVTGLARRRRAR